MNKVHAVGVIFENSKGEILVLKRHSDSLEGKTWSLVGGHVDDGENRQQAAVREVREEVGINIIYENQLKFCQVPISLNKHSLLYLNATGLIFKLV